MSAAQPRPVALATDCSGMETPVMALQNLGVVIDHVFSCDVNAHAKKTIMANFPPKVFFDDLTVRDNAKAPKADLYVAGFPCQPFSTAGLQQGFSDARGRGEIFWHVRDYLEKQLPKVFVLENVSGLVKINNGDYLAAILRSLEALGAYNIYHKVLDTKDHGVPQSRQRIYIVGIKRSCDDGSFEFPEPVPRPSIELFLEPRKGRPTRNDLPPVSQGTARANVIRAIREIYKKGHDPLKVPFVVDCDSSAPRMKYVKGVTPCVTCSRAAGHWITNRMRRLSKSEMMQSLQKKSAQKSVIFKQNSLKKASPRPSSASRSATPCPATSSSGSSSACCLLPGSSPEACSATAGGPASRLRPKLPPLPSAWWPSACWRRRPSAVQGSA